MHSGYLFHLDYWSNEENLQHIFRYRKIKKKNYDVIKASKEYKDIPVDVYRSIPDYPVYVTLNPSNISFHFIGIKFLEKNFSKEFSAQHYEIITLPLSKEETFVEELTEVLKNSVDEVSEFSNLYERNDALNVFQPLSYETLDSLSESDKKNVKFLTYSSLEHHMVYTTKEEYVRENNDSQLFYAKDISSLIAANPRSSNFFFFLPNRELILDFLFDLKHSTIFENSPFFDDVVKSLKTNAMLMALDSKCEYYYNVIQFQNNEDTFVKSKSEGVGNKNSPYQIFDAKWNWFQKVKKSERKYLNAIFSLTAPDAFYHSGGWFFSIEKELKAILFNDNPRSSFDRIFLDKIFRRGNSFLMMIVKIVILLGLVGLSFFVPLKVVLLISIVFVFFLLLKKKSIKNSSAGYFNREERYRWYRDRIQLKEDLGKDKSVLEKLKEEVKNRGQQIDLVNESLNKAIEKLNFSYKEINLELTDSELHTVLDRQVSFLGNAQEKLDTEMIDDREFTYKLQRKINNFLLGRFNLANAFRHTLPLRIRLPVSVILAFCVISFFLFLIFLLFFCNAEDAYDSIAYFLLVIVGVTFGGAFGIVISYVIHRMYYLKKGDLFLNRLKSISIWFGLVLSTYIGVMVFTTYKFEIFNNETLCLLFSLMLFCIFTFLTKAKGWYIFLSLGFSVLMYFAYKNWTNEVAILPLSFLLFYMIYLFLFVERREIVNLYRFTFNLILPRMQMAIVSSWILLIGTEELWKANLDIDASVLVMVVLVVLHVSFFILVYVMTNSIGDLQWPQLFVRSGVILLYGFMFSLSFGVVSMSILGKKVIFNSGIMEQWYSIDEADRLNSLRTEVELQTTELENRNQTSLYFSFNSNATSGANLYTPGRVLKDEIILAKKYFDFETFYLQLDTFINTIPFSQEDTSLMKNLKKENVLLKNNNDLYSKSISQLDDLLDSLTSSSNNEFNYFDIAYQLDSLKSNAIADNDKLLLLVDDIKGYFDRREFKEMKYFEKLSENNLFIEIDVINQLGLISEEVKNSRSDTKVSQSKVNLFPKILLLNTVFALFIGIFFQVIIQDKSITDPI